MSVDLVAEALALLTGMKRWGPSPPRDEDVDLWAPRALRDTLDDYEREVERWAHSYSREERHPSRTLLWEVARLLRGGVPRRPRRRMPTIGRIAEHHEMPDDECWRCLQPRSLQRAHIVDRVFDGLDGPQNLALLCDTCHRRMPIVKPEDWETGLRYVGLARPG